ncbi:MAG: hypothetical protein AB7Q23_14600 [Hyphomonadaceae bacterium]
MKDLASVLAVIAIGFALGVASSSNVQGLWRLLQGDVSVRCLEYRACVGDTVGGFLVSYDADGGGLSGVFCTATGSEPEPRRARENNAFLLPQIVAGRTCPSADYLLEFRNPSTRTLVPVENGVVAKIDQGPLHTIDF